MNRESTPAPRRRRGTAVLAALLALGAGTAPAAPARAATGPCTGWTTTTLAAGLGKLENVHPDGRGGAYLSVLDPEVVLHLSADGGVTTLADDVPLPAGMRLRGTDLYVLSGNAGPAILPPATGKLYRIDTRTGARQVVATGLRSPNGLAELPDGTFLASRLGLGDLPTGITRIDPATGAIQPNWSTINMGNGMEVSPDGRSLYVNQTLSGEVLRVSVSAPSAPVRVARIPGLLPGPDDLDVTDRNVLYVAANTGDAVHRVDPGTGWTCKVAGGLGNPSAVKVDSGASGQSLLVTNFDGTVKRLTPPTAVVP